MLKPSVPGWAPSHSPAAIQGDYGRGRGGDWRAYQPRWLPPICPPSAKTTLTAEGYCNSKCHLQAIFSPLSKFYNNHHWLQYLSFLAQGAPWLPGNILPMSQDASKWGSPGNFLSPCSPCIKSYWFFIVPKSPHLVASISVRSDTCSSSNPSSQPQQKRQTPMFCCNSWTVLQVKLLTTNTGLQLFSGCNKHPITLRSHINTTHTLDPIFNIHTI